MEDGLAKGKTVSLLVAGGNGFVGSAVCVEAVRRGYNVTSISRSGNPPSTSHLKKHTTEELLLRQVRFEKADIFAPNEYKHLLNGQTAVISCVGGFKDALNVNGQANATIVGAAKAAGVPRFVYISARRFNHLPKAFMNTGYYRGKLLAEEEVKKQYGTQGIILRPAMISGHRIVAGGKLTLPLNWIGTPLEYILRTKPATWFSSTVFGSYFDLLLAPPEPREAVARAAVDAAVDQRISGTLEVDDIHLRHQ